MERLVIGLCVLVGLFLMADTGFTPLNWQFWVVFLPLYAAAECALIAWSHRQQVLEAE
jgi:hypothetical protein